MNFTRPFLYETMFYIHKKSVKMSTLLKDYRLNGVSLLQNRFLKFQIKLETVLVLLVDNMKQGHTQFKFE